MNANTWFPSEVNTSSEKKNFDALTDNEQAIYKMTFAQLSFNDSAQEEYLSDFRSLANNRLVKATITLQMMQEVNHSKSYAVLLDACGNSDEVFNLYKYDDALNNKNQKIAEQFARHIDGGSVDKMLLSAMASVNLEGIYFLLGFSYIYLLGDKVPGARDMIKFIARDELNTHLPLFANIFKTIQKENKIMTSTIDSAYTMIDDAVKIELEYGKYLLHKYPIMGVTPELMESTVYNYANDRLKKIGLEPIFTQTDTTYLQKLVTKHLNMNEVKSNFFESNVSNYAKSSIDLNDF
jgi:ribonucleoside-diphosphate reductase beta chain